MVFGFAFLTERGRVFGHHLGVHRESTCGDDDSLGGDLADLAEVFPAHADHCAVVIGDECCRSRFIAELNTQVCGAVD